MTQYAVARTGYVTEKEIFIRSIIGRSGAGSKLQREQSDYMKARFNRDLRDIKSWMENHALVEGTPGGFLRLAAACLRLAAKVPSNVSTGRLGTSLKSFGWFAAGLCVPELVKERSDSGSVSSRFTAPLPYRA
ncbi:hypothetical protein PMZ80_007819 [Knufia obscura]|uniref:Uncharacterized protein n=1 Tax=Knufia obscura TaxID=1635080 RepID=A0ABR0RJJ7_9EURO|nr:hypothetical protein PMZ80_007819 [Knufia obscura]